MPSVLFVLFAVLLLPSIFDVVLSAGFSFPIQPCNATEDTRTQIGDYSYSGIPTFPSEPLCPLSSSNNLRWSYNLSGNASVFSNQSFSPDQICVKSTQLFFSNTFVSSVGDGVGYIFFLVNGNPLTVRYAPIGIFQIEPSNNTVSLDEGESYLAELIFLAYIGQLDINMDPNLYKVSASGDLILVPSNNSGVSINRIVSITDYCHTGLLSAPDPKPVRVVIRNPGIADSGTYAVIVTIDGVNYTANFTINVSPSLPPTISPSPTTTSSIIMTSSVVSINVSSPTISTTGSTVSPSVDTTITLSPSPTGDTSSGISLVIYVVFGFLIFVGIIVCTTVALLAGLWWCRIKSERRVTEIQAPEVRYVPGGEEESKIEGVSITDSGRTGSNSSTRPLVHSRPSSTSSTQSTKQEDYTAVYCDERHANIGKLWKKKLGNKCTLLPNDSEILTSLETPSCCEIFVFADPRDPVFIATISRGIPRSREKLKWWQFVKHDKTPNHSIEVEGFKIIQVEGDPNDFSTLQLGMLKTDQPTFNHTNGVLYENRIPNGHSNASASYPEDTDSAKKKPKEEIDGLASNDGGSATDALKELVQEQRKTNEYLKEIKKNTGQTASNTKETAETEKSILGIHEEAQVGINEDSV